MDKHLHIHILEVLQQNNAVGQMVDIKPAFGAELNTQDGRKNFKTQLDYLVSEQLIETTGKFEFLTWELLTGLYPIENKKIEAKLTGNWQSYISKRGAIRNDPANQLPQAAPPAPEPKKPGLYDAPSAVLPYPGVSGNKPTPEPFRPSAKVDEDFEPFKVKKPAPQPHPDADKFLKEEDFLPFKVRNANKPKEEFGRIPQDEPILISKHPGGTKPEPLKAPAEEPFFTSQTPYSPPASEPKKPEPDMKPFSAGKVSYTAPRDNNYKVATPDDNKNIAVPVKPFTPYKPAVTPPPEKPPRIQGNSKRIADKDDDTPIITARAAKRPPAAEAPVPELPEPVKATPASSVVNLRSSVPLHPEQAPVRQQVPSSNHPPPPPTTNFAAIRFDTENNPFNSLGTINLDPDDEKNKPKTPNWQPILKWAVLAFIILLIIVVFVVFKKRYS